MPLFSGDDFVPVWPYRNGHLNTLAPYFFGKIKPPPYIRQRITTPDGDFLDLDTIYSGSPNLVILCHGLEGSSASNYMQQFANFFVDNGLDVLAMNYRGCSGEPNRRAASYNSGTTDDLDLVIKQAGGGYDNIFLVGFSLGGNLILKYLGEGRHELDARIRKVVALSAPVHLSDASAALLKFENVLYQLKFLVSLYKKTYQKHKMFPKEVPLKPLRKVFHLRAFDEYYTAPLFGYSGAEDYYADNQSIHWLHQIQHPTLIINAKDDPFLGDLCYPFEIAKQSEFVSLCVPRYGGHVGFSRDKFDRSWILEKTWAFLQDSMA